MTSFRNFLIWIVEGFAGCAEPHCEQYKLHPNNKAGAKDENTRDYRASVKNSARNR